MACDPLNSIEMVASQILLNTTLLEERILPNDLNGCLNIVNLGANLLGLAIALLALVTSCVAFLLPLMITAVGNYQMAFFNSVTNPQCILAIKRIGKTEKVTRTIGAIEKSALFMNNIYRVIMIVSISAFCSVIISIIANAILVGNSRNLIYWLLIILLLYLLTLIFCLIKILQTMFQRGTNGSYVALAELQGEIIRDIYRDKSTDSNIGADDNSDVFLIYHKKRGK